MAKNKSVGFRNFLIIIGVIILLGVIIWFAAATVITYTAICSHFVHYDSIADKYSFEKDDGARWDLTIDGRHYTNDNIDDILTEYDYSVFDGTLVYIMKDGKEIMTFFPKNGKITSLLISGEECLDRNKLNMWTCFLYVVRHTFDKDAQYYYMSDCPANWELCGVSAGMTKQEVTDLLGEQDRGIAAVAMYFRDGYLASYNFGYDNEKYQSINECPPDECFVVFGSIYADTNTSKANREQKEKDTE